MPRTKGSKNKPKNTLKKGIPHIPALVYVDGHKLIAEIESGAYKIYVTDTHAVVKSTYFTAIYENPSLQYQSYLYVATLYTNPSRTEEETEMLNSLTIMYPDFVGFHNLYFTDVTLAKDMYDYHFKYLNNRIKEIELQELVSDNPDALEEVKESERFKEEMLKSEDLQN